MICLNIYILHRCVIISMNVTKLTHLLESGAGKCLRGLPCPLLTGCMKSGSEVHIDSAFCV